MDKTFTIGLALALASTALLVMTEANAAEFLQAGYIQQALISLGWPVGVFGAGFGFYLMFATYPDDGMDDDLDSEFPENYEPEPGRPDRDANRIPGREPEPALAPNVKRVVRTYKPVDQHRWVDTMVV